MAYLKNWTDNFFQIFFMGTSCVAASINNNGRGICHLGLPCWKYVFKVEPNNNSHKTLQISEQNFGAKYHIKQIK